LVFSSLTFLYVFLPLCLIFYYAVRGTKAKNYLLLAASLFFYAWGEPKWIIILIISTLVEYIGAIFADKYRGTKKAKLALGLSVGTALAFLFVFKYLDFFSGTLNGIFNWSLPASGLALPIGISFYTFQTITYTVDVYRGKAPVQRNFAYLLLYVSMFPQLIAGPIVKYTDVNDQIEKRDINISKTASGMSRFSIGLAKKAILANMSGQIATQFMAGDLSHVSVLGAWVGLLGYTLQIYFDFSAYSDMAIGLGKMLGFDYLENFNYPYISRSITEFWKRWHISLTTFFREYLYIPLGGNRKHHVRNLLIVWFLTGLWHGASWNFILWGLYYFVFIVIERLFLGDALDKAPAFVGRIYSMFVVMIGWVLFYYDDMSRLRQFMGLLFGANGAAFSNELDSTFILNRLVFIAVAIIAVTPVKELFNKLMSLISSKSENSFVWSDIIKGTGTLALLFFSTASLVGETYNPFLYFRF
jgi:alginate O-acetyltransferase complex protein AlgI